MPAVKKVAIVLTGCGHRDGTEVHEASSVMSAVSECGYQMDFYSQQVEFEVIDHLSGKKTGEKRNCITEAARIARKDIGEFCELKHDDYSALLIPGGIGALNTLYDPKVRRVTTRVLKDFIQAKKTIVAICIAPKTIANCIEDCDELSGKFELTVGNDISHFDGLSKTTGIKTSFNEFHVDKANKIYSTGAFMHGDVKFGAITETIRNCVKSALT